MKFNTLIQHRMKATYNPWVERLDRNTNLIYRQYLSADTEEIDCTITVSGIGNMMLYADRELQMFAVIRDMLDASGESFMNDQWYVVQRVLPVLDAFGHRTSYRHQLAGAAAEVFTQPINPRPDYPDIDQVS